MSRFGAALVTLVALAVLAGTATGSTQPRVADRDCGDFSTQAAAQQVFIAQGGPRSDPFALDADRDGVACETLPCPCAGGGGGNPAPQQPAHSRRATVVEVTDGDTIKVRLRHRSDSVRLIGIDTPEVYGG